MVMWVVCHVRLARCQCTARHTKQRLAHSPLTAFPRGLASVRYLVSMSYIYRGRRTIRVAKAKDTHMHGGTTPVMHDAR